MILDSTCISSFSVTIQARVTRNLLQGLSKILTLNVFHVFVNLERKVFITVL